MFSIHKKTESQPVWRAFSKITENDHSHIYKAKEDL